ncbi:Protein FEZ like [Abeliophyllum distichum]|uniref:Protein FEZ like n=1 Tax=Abeliophyllum distichum TaxID=126358 RepID=A0ABD1VZY7_9LAMI
MVFLLPKGPKVQKQCTTELSDWSWIFEGDWHRPAYLLLGRIFKKASSSIQRALPHHTWVPETTASDLLNPHSHTNAHLAHKTISAPIASFSPTENVHSYKPMENNLTLPYQVSVSNENLTTSYTFSSTEKSKPASKRTMDASSLLLNMSSSIYGDYVAASLNNVDYNILKEVLPQDFVHGNISHREETALLEKRQPC